MKELVYDLVDHTWKGIQEYESYLDNIKNNKGYYEHKAEVLRGKISLQVLSSIAGILMYQFIEESLNAVVPEIADEMMSINNFSRRVILNFITAGIKRQRTVPQTDEALIGVIEELIDNDTHSI